MPEQKNNRLLSWLVTRPLMFAVIAFITMTATTLIAGTIGGNIAGPLANILGIIAFLGACAWLVRKLPAGNLDRHNFIAITNAQTVITSFALIISSFLFLYNYQAIMLRLLWMESHSTPAFMIIVIAMVIFYLYICGLFIANLYAKYRRIRAMGVGMWKTLATAPFGFCMLWIPGYLMPNATNKTDNNNGWYNRFTNWIMTHPSRSAGALVILILLTGFTFGFNSIILTLGLAALFAIWCAIIGPDKMRKNLSGVYSTTAIIINVVTILGIIGYFIVAAPRTNPAIETPEMVQYIDTVQQQ